ncbi:MAG: hypothetical protein F6J93_20525 [Oscillatoria sp. SIO1A7]|nr:hypothetical protein [Oscillatoria sp. SIO1A7]
MTKTDILELAKQGYPKAIATLINRSLEPKGISAKVALSDGCLQVLLEADKVPNQKVLANFIYQGTLELGAESIQSVKVYGRSLGKSKPAWSEQFDLDNPTSLPAQTSNSFLYTGRENQNFSSGRRAKLDLERDGLKQDGLKQDGLKQDGLKRNGLKPSGLKPDRLEITAATNGFTSAKERNVVGESAATKIQKTKGKNKLKQTEKKITESATESPDESLPLTVKDCEDLLHEVGHFPSKGSLNVAYYYAIPKLAPALVNFLNSAGSIVAAIGTRYRGEIACLIITEKYLACFSLPEFSKTPKKEFVFKLRNLDRIAIAKNGIIVYRKKHPGLTIYFYERKTRDSLKKALGNKVKIQQRRLIPPDLYEIGFAFLGCVTLVLCIWINLLALWALFLFLLNVFLGPLN